MAKKEVIESLSPEEKYAVAIAKGREIATGNPSGNFPKGSVGQFLSKGFKKIKGVYDYYSRSDIQWAIFQYAMGRRITYLRLFRPMYSGLKKPGDVLPLALYTLFEKGNYWPSIHGTISRYTSGGGRLSDVIIEIDFKQSWKKCFEMTRPIVDMLQSRGAIFRLKFSGHCSVHIIIPAEALRVQGHQLDHSDFFRRLSDLVKKKLKEPRYLDTSFHIYEHYLRLAYSLNENTGLVSLPFDLKDYDRFDPDQASPDRVRPLPGWWSFPKDAARQMQEFVEFVTRGNITLENTQAGQLPATPDFGTQNFPVDQKLIHQVRQQKRAAAREFLPNEGFYDRMVRIGQDMVDLREFLLLEDRASKTALRSLRHLYQAEREFDIGSVAKIFDIDESDLRLLWKWELNEKALSYYARDEIKQAIFEYAEKRKIRVPGENRLFILQEPADILPLMAYSFLGDTKIRDKYPSICAANSKYERTGEIPISCDLKIEFSTRREDESVIEAAMPVISLLSGFDMTFFILFDGMRSINLIIPYESFPEAAKLASIRHEDVISKLTPHLKRFMRMPGAACTLIKDPNSISIVPYSIHPQTGLVCVPINLSDLRSFSPGDAILESIQVDNEWWNVPDDAPVAMANFFKQMAPINF